MIIVIVVN